MCQKEYTSRENDVTSAETNAGRVKKVCPDRDLDIMPGKLNKGRIGYRKLFDNPLPKRLSSGTAKISKNRLFNAGLLVLHGV